jgi:hypothetical protein
MMAISEMLSRDLSSPVLVPERLSLVPGSPISVSGLMNKIFGIPVLVSERLNGVFDAVSGSFILADADDGAPIVDADDQTTQIKSN